MHYHEPLYGIAGKNKNGQPERSTRVAPSHAEIAPGEQDRNSEQQQSEDSQNRDDSSRFGGCQRKVEMSYSLQSRNVRFLPGGARGRGSLGVPVRRRRAMLASNPIKE